MKVCSLSHLLLTSCCVARFLTCQGPEPGLLSWEDLPKVTQPARVQSRLESKAVVLPGPSLLSPWMSGWMALMSTRHLSPPSATNTASQQPSPEFRGAFFICTASRTNPKTIERSGLGTILWATFSAHITTKAKVNATSLLVLALSLSVTMPTSVKPTPELTQVCSLGCLPHYPPANAYSSVKTQVL